MKNKYLYLYYFVLILALALYTNTSGSPNTLIRLAYLGALVVPLLENVAMYPAVILCTLSISKNTFAYPFMPTEMYYYVLLSAFFALLVVSKKRYTLSIKPLFIVILLYIGANDLFLKGEFSPIVTIVFIAILMHFISGSDIVKSSNLLPLSFIFLSITLSCWVLFVPAARLNIYNRLGDFEQVGWQDPNYLGCALGMGMVVAVQELLLVKKNRLYSLLSLLTIGLSVFSLVTIASRGMILAAATSTGIMLLFSKANKSTKVITIVAMALFIIALYNSDYLDFVLDRFNAEDGTGGNRTPIWTRKISAFFQEGNALNYLFGFGQRGGFALGFGSSGASTHNDYISALVYYGFTGLLLMIMAFIHPIKTCAKNVRPQIVALLVYLLMCSMTIEPLASGRIAYIAFFFYITQMANASRQPQLTNGKA